VGHIRDRSLPRKLIKTRGRVGYPSKISLLNDLTGMWAGKSRVCAGILISIVKEQAMHCCYQTANKLHHYVSRLTAPGQGNNDQGAGLRMGRGPVIRYSALATPRCVVARFY